MMVQLQNSDRLNQAIEFGTIDDQDYDVNGVLKNTFVVIGNPTLCGRWKLTTSQMVERDGLQRTDSFIIVVHHRRSWDGITHAKLGETIYQVSDINPDSYQNPTAYDLLTLTKVGENDG